MVREFETSLHSHACMASCNVLLQSHTFQLKFLDEWAKYKWYIDHFLLAIRLPFKSEDSSVPYFSHWKKMPRK